MENNTELTDAINNFVETFKVAIEPVLDALIKLADNIANIFKYEFEKFTYNTRFITQTVTRKRFTKLLMSIGYDRNTANKLAWQYNKQKGKYTIIDFCIEKRKLLDNL